MNEASLGGDTLILLVFVWFVGGVAWTARGMLKDCQDERTKSAETGSWGLTVSDLRSALEGLAAIVISVVLYFFLKWFEAVGWVGYLLYAIPIALVLSFLAKRSRIVRDGIPSTFEWAFDLLERKIGWIAGLIGVLWVGGIIYFFLFAPYGILCMLGLRPCGIH